MIVDSEYIIENYPSINKQEIISTINKFIDNTKENKVKKQEFSHNFFRCRKENKLTINKADKGNIITIEKKRRKKSIKPVSS